MLEPIILQVDEVVDARPFTDPNHSLRDLERMRKMIQQLVDTCDDPVICDFVPGKRAVCQSDLMGRQFEIFSHRAYLLRKNLTVVGLFGQKRPQADIRPLIQADKKYEREFNKHPSLLSLSTVRIPNGDFGKLVLFTDPGSRDTWNEMPLH